MPKRPRGSPRGVARAAARAAAFERLVDRALAAIPLPYSEALREVDRIVRAMLEDGTVARILAAYGLELRPPRP